MRARTPAFRAEEKDEFPNRIFFHHPLFESLLKRFPVRRCKRQAQFANRQTFHKAIAAIDKPLPFPNKDRNVRQHKKSLRGCTFFLLCTCCLLYTSPSPRDR